MIKEKRFLPVEHHEPMEEDMEFELDFSEDDEKKNLQKKKGGLYVAS